MGEPKLPPGAKLISLNPEPELKLPPGAKLADMPADFETAPDFKPSQTQQFFGKLLEDTGSAIPGGMRLIKGLANPVTTLPTLVDAGKGLVRSVTDPVKDIASGNYGRGLAGAAEFAAPFALKGAGKLLVRGSGPLAETAMHVGKADRLAEANPGRALIHETNKIRPLSISRDLGKKGAQLAADQERRAAAATVPGDLGPAIRPIADRMDRAASAGATTTAEQLVPMRSYFEGPAPAGFSGSTIPGPGGVSLIAPQQPPLQLLHMRREFTPNFRIRYGPAADSTIQKVGRQAYRGLSDEVKRVVPGAAETDPRLHDIIAAADAAESVSRNAGMFQRTAGRLAAHTGALAGGIFGYHYGGPFGALGGLLLPEMVASPSLQMAGARAMYGLGRGMQKPLITIPATVGAKIAANQR